MSARQNKKQRKGRNNANNRERTVTTLTEDPNTPYLVPTPSEEPAGANLMSSPFSVASSSAGNPSNIPPAAYQIPGTFAFGFNNYAGPMHGSVHHQQHQQQQQPQQFYASQQQQTILPPGKNDLEVLEKLKEMIKNGQHEFYRAVPQPAALASIYLGPNSTSQPQVPHHPEQAPEFHRGAPPDGQQQGNPPGSGPSSPVDLGRRPPRTQSKDSWDSYNQRKSIGAATTGGSQSINNSNQASHSQTHGGRGSGAPAAINTSNLHSNGKSNISGPPSAGAKSSIDMHTSDSNPSALSSAGPEPPSPSQRPARFDSAPNSGNSLDQARLTSDRLGHGESAYGGPRGPGDISPNKSSPFDGKDDVSRTPRESGWSIRDGVPPLEDRRRDSDHPLPSPTSRLSINGHGGSDIRSSGPGDRAAPPSVPPVRDDRYYDRDRERDRDRDRDRRDWERERRPFDRFRDSRMTDARRPPPEQRHYEPDYDRPPVPRRYDQKGPEEPVDGRRLPDGRAPSTPTIDDRGVRPPPPVDDRLASARAQPVDPRASVDSHISLPDSRAPLPESRIAPPDNRPVRGPYFDDRHGKPDDRRGPLSTDDRARQPVPAPRPGDVPGPSRPGVDDRNVARASPALPVDDRTSRPQVPLEERINRPSLQDRLSQPPPTRSESNHLSRQASLEERLSHPPIPPADDRTGRPPGIPDRTGVRPGPPDDRNNVRPASVQDERVRLDDRPGRPVERYTRPASPPPPLDGSQPPHRSAAHPPPRSGSIVRDDPRALNKAPPTPPLRPVSRDYRPPGRPLSRERGPYRPDDRPYPDDRRPDIMDVDGPLRYADRVPADRVPYRPFSPPSAADLARDRARAQFPHSPRASVASVEPPYDDPERRFSGPGSSGRDWPYQYGEGRRDWTAAEEDSYWKSRPQWDRNNPPPDRDRFEREIAPPPFRNHGWETRDERDRRDSFPRGSSPRSFDGPPRPLSSRLTDNYSSAAPGAGPPVDRSYPPPPSRDVPPFTRVRQRSPSPVRRPGPGPGPGPIDDTRPPMKRPRDDAYSTTGYYPPPNRDPPLRRPADYPPRGLSPPPSSGGSGYYDRGGPPPSSSSTTASAPNDRDYPPGRDRGASLDYPAVPSYDRPRSPGPARGYSRGGYTRGGDARDDRRYPPPTSMPPPRRP